MLKSILIGLDGSPTCEAAVDLGIQWAKRFDALLIGLAVVVEPLRHMREPGDACADESGQEPAGDSETKACRTTERYLDRFAARCTAAGVKCNLHQGTGTPYEEILRESQRYDLVLFGHETHFHFSALDQANETRWKVLKQESRPIVIAPKNWNSVLR